MGGFRLTSRVMVLAAPVVVAGLVLATPSAASDPNICDEPGEAPDLVTGGLDHVQAFGSVDGVSAYAIGATTCNIGTCWADWFFSTTAHPVFAQNLFRLFEGRFEQIGQSWVHHRFFALSGIACDPGCVPTDGTHLGVQCSTSNSANSTGNQSYLGPKSEVRAATGSFVYPFTGIGETGNHVFKRLQVREEDLEPVLNPGALYFAEGQNVTADDAAAGNQHNNASYRRVNVAWAGNYYSLSATGTTQVGHPAITAWPAVDSGVRIELVDVPGDGRYYVASQATPIGGGRWRYEYAIQNLDSDRAARSVRVPVPAGAGITNLGFHDVDYHSGEPFDGSDWQIEVDTDAVPNAVAWTTEDFDGNPYANALRWGTLYNFRFEADVPPASGALDLVLFEPGVPSLVAVSATAPRLCDEDGDCEPGEGHCNCAVDCGNPTPLESECSDGQDNDCDGLGDCEDPDCCGGPECSFPDDDGDTFLACEDCNDGDPAIWGVPDEVALLTLDRNALGWAALSWDPPAHAGCVYPEYDVLRSFDPADFMEAVCLGQVDPETRTALDTMIPLGGGVFSYLVRARNACPGGSGPLGDSSGGAPRAGAVCPQD